MTPAIEDGGTGLPCPTAEQRLAANPSLSVWVTANAGTGKTKILTDRVLRLLLQGVPPENLLCLTFTKAAAAEMIARVEAKLAAWANAEPGALAAELEQLTGELILPQSVERAAGLFAQVLELPHGLPIMTIHGFCGMLLRRFPLEARIAPFFTTLDERDAAELLAEARERVLTAAAADPLGELGIAVNTLALAQAEGGLSQSLRELAEDRRRLKEAIDRYGSRKAVIDEVYRLLDLTPGTSAREIIRQACRDGEHDREALCKLAAALQATGKIDDAKWAEALGTWLGCGAAGREAGFQTYRRWLLTEDGAQRKRRSQTGVADHLLRPLSREQARLIQVCDRLKRVEVACRTAALLTVGGRLLDEFAALKRRRAGLDYEDLIERALTLLAAPGGGDWVRYKLDWKISHLLVDEAQDTSPSQWRLILQLVEEFVAGEGTRDERRTVFVAGDEKQSIYSFQGADLAAFRDVRDRLLMLAGSQLAEISIEMSFRSGPAVLEAVDRVFATAKAKEGVVAPGQALRHVPFREHAPSQVEIWPLLLPPDREPTEPWPLPMQPRAVDTAAHRLADAIAAQIADWLGQAGEILPCTGAPARPADVLILLARRGVMQELLIRALRRRGVPVAGTDRLLLTEHIAVQDLMALARAVLLPEDDLSLACLLKSPLVGLDEEELFQLACDRGPRLLIQRLRDLASDGAAPFAGAWRLLAAWRARADFMPPFEFFASVLGEADGSGRTGRQRMTARLGRDAALPIEAFLDQCLAYEQGHPVSLQGFAHWLELGSNELKRDPEIATDGVRIATVHGAKGLQAPIVVLADAGAHDDAPKSRIVWDGPSGLPFWRMAAAARDDCTQAMCNAETRSAGMERQRLLYVAMTRARDRLLIAGCGPARTKAAGGAAEDGPSEAEPQSWHDHVWRAMRELPEVEVSVMGLPFAGSLLRLRRGRRSDRQVRSAPDEAPTPALPAWALQPVPDEPPAPATAATPPSPERAADDPTANGVRGLARSVGRHVHRLLELLPVLPERDRAAGIERYLAQAAADLPDSAPARIADAVRRLLSQPELGPVFGPRARAEQPIGGQVGDRLIAGQIDRLVVLAEEVIAVDFKTDRRPPAPDHPAPRAYLTQMASYRALLSRLHPDLPIRCGLVWTETGDVTWLPAELLGNSIDNVVTP